MLTPWELPSNRRKFPYKRGFLKAVRTGDLFYYNHLSNEWERCVHCRVWGADMMVTAFRQTGECHEFVPRSSAVFCVLHAPEIRLVKREALAHSQV